MDRKGTVALLALIVVVLFGVYLRIGPPPPPETVRVVTPPTIIASLPIWVAEEKGIFTAHGLNVQLVDLTDSRLMVEAMLAKNADVLPAVSLADLTNAGSPGNIPLMHVRIYSHSRMMKSPPFESILTQAVNSVGTLKDLEGKRIAVYPGMTSALAVKHFLDRSGIDTSKVTFAKLPPPEHESSLLRGDVQAIHVYEPFRTLSLQNGKTRELSGSVYASLNEPSGIGCSAISRNFLRDSPRTASKFLDAWDDAIQFIRRNPEESRQILAKRLSLPETVAKSATWVDATTSSETSYKVLSDTINSAKGAGIVSGDFILEKDMVLTR